MEKSKVKSGASSSKSSQKSVKSGSAKSGATKSRTTRLSLPKEQLKIIYDNMVKSRVLEERLIRIYKSGQAYFWIGAPGEEGFGVPLGLLVNKGKGVQHDWLHLHYRATPTLIAMGMPMIDSVRLIMNTAKDVSTGGRNFSNHYCYPEWNVAPITSPIEVQYSMALGTAWAQKRHKAKGVTIVSGGDAGTAEGDFASCLIWSSRPGNELPMLITVQNNRWGISTNYESQHGEKYIADRGKAFGIRTAVINGNDPVECYLRTKEELDYIRKTGKPVVAEYAVSRLYGHSSASGANRNNDEIDVLQTFEEELLRADVLKKSDVKQIYDDYNQESLRAVEEARKDPAPQGDTIWDHVYVGNENADWRKF
ncbi:MAG: thiamine pyrophosphate-dependent dehydrogenase E1 component subunit alpha [Bdellovibrionales bacterium]|nr:thiamine pyrophosphate-dependent dehydrogenase E1 component subunit alpha [Bdellovibrionales bacterium]